MSATFKRRMGITGLGNSKPYDQWSKTLTTMVTGEGHVPGTTSGAIFHLPCNNWNDPMGSLATMVAGVGTLDQNRHPVHHNDAIADGYNTVQVLSWKAKIQPNWIATNDPDGDFYLAYAFKSDIASQVNLAVGDPSRTNRMRIMTSPRWTVTHFHARSGEGKRAEGDGWVTINVPNVFEYCRQLHAGAQIGEGFGSAMVSHTIADVGATVNPPLTPLFCVVVIASESGLVMPVDVIHTTLQITQTVRIMRNWTGAADLQGGIPDIH